MGQIICSCCSKLTIGQDDELCLIQEHLYQSQIPVLPRTMKYHMLFCCDTTDLQGVNTIINEAQQKGFLCCEFEKCAMPNRTEVFQLDMFITESLWVVIYFSDKYCTDYCWSELQIAAAVECALALKRKNILLIMTHRLEGLIPKILSTFPRVSMMDTNWKESFFDILGKIPDHLSKSEICGCKSHLDLEKQRQRNLFYTSSDETPRIQRQNQLGRSAIPESSIPVALQMQSWINIQMPVSVRPHYNSC